MSYYSDKVGKLRSLPNRYILLFVTAKALGGIGIGVLLANWLATWTWRVFVAIACVIALPIAWKILGK